MPYIERVLRPMLRPRRAPHPAENSGELSYQIAHLIEEYRQNKGDSWQTFSDVYGALEGAHREFQINVVDPYEEQKKVKDGAIFAPIKKGTL